MNANLNSLSVKHKLTELRIEALDLCSHHREHNDIYEASKALGKAEGLRQAYELIESMEMEHNTGIPLSNQYQATHP